MSLTQEYVLRRLDRWYVEICEKYYTSGLEDKVRKKIRDRARTTRGEEKEMLRRMAESGALSREAQIQSAQGYFSTIRYATLEKLVILASKIPLTSTAEYGITKMNEFVKEVVAVAEDKRTSVSNEDIELAFLRTFGDYRGFSKWVTGHMDNTAKLAEQSRKKGEMSEEQYKNLLSMVKMGKKVQGYVTKALFGHIRDKKT